MSTSFTFQGFWPVDRKGVYVCEILYRGEHVAEVEKRGQGYHLSIAQRFKRPADAKSIWEWVEDDSPHEFDLGEFMDALRTAQQRCDKDRINPYEDPQGWLHQYDPPA